MIRLNSLPATRFKASPGFSSEDAMPSTNLSTSSEVADRAGHDASMPHTKRDRSPEGSSSAMDSSGSAAAEKFSLNTRQRSKGSLESLVKRLRHERSVLKQAVIEEQQRSHQMQQNIYSLAKSKRRSEAENAAHQEEIDRLGFSNEQLKSRINQMMKEFKDMEEKRANSAANGGGSMLERLIGAGVTEEVDQLRAQIEVLQDELQIKIKENECVHIKQFELTQEHEEQIAALRRRLKAALKSHDALKAVLESKQRLIDDLAGEKEEREQRGDLLEESLQRVRREMTSRFKGMATANKSLQEDLSRARHRLRVSVPFDDHAVKHWNAWNLPPYHHRRLRAVSDCMIKVSHSVKAAIHAYIKRAEVEAQLLRTRSHHPDMKSIGSAEADDGTVAEASADETPQEAGKALKGRHSYMCEREGLLIQAAEVAASLLREDSADDVDPENGENDDSEKEGAKHILRLVETFRQLVGAERQLIAQFDDGRHELSSSFAHENRNASASVDRSATCKKAMKSTLAALDAIFAALQSLKRAIDNRGNKMPSGSVFDLAVSVFSFGDLGPGLVSSSLVMPFIVALPDLATQLARAARARATVVANDLVLEQRTPFLPKRVRSLLDVLQNAEFEVATSVERMSEEIKRTSETSGISSLQRPAAKQCFPTLVPEKGNDEKTINMKRLSSNVVTMRAKLAERGRKFHLWGRRQPMPSTLPHVHALRYRDELEKEKARVSSLSSRLETFEKETAEERVAAETRLENLQELLDKCTRERDQLIEKSKRANEESNVAQLSWAETERHLRARIAKLRGGREAKHGEKSGIQDESNAADSRAKDHVSELNLPWGIGIGGSDLEDNSDDNFDNFDGDMHNTSSGSIVRENLDLADSPFGNRARGWTHAKAAGQARYTMHVLDREGIVRGLNSLVQNKSLDEQKREERIIQHYEAIIASRDLQVEAADAEAVSILKKYRLSLSKLKKLIRASQEHEKSVRDSNERVKRAKDELEATREAMGAQSKMLSQRVMELEEKSAGSVEMVDRIANAEVRCIHCHGWNRIGRIVGCPGEKIKVCLHCNRNPGCRTLNGET